VKEKETLTQKLVIRLLSTTTNFRDTRVA